MIDESWLDLDSEEIKHAERMVREAWGAEIDAMLDPLLEYRMMQEDDGLDSVREQTVVIHYKTKRSFDDFHQEYEEAAESSPEDGLDDEVDFVERFADEEARSLIRELGVEGAGVEEHLRLANAVVTKLSARQVKAMAACAEVERIEANRAIALELDQSTVTIGVVSARSQGLVGTGEGVVVAVIDGEVDKAHPDFLGRVIHKRNYTSETWGSPHRHGTHVAGIIAGNGPRYQGVAPGAIIWSYKIYPSGQAESAEGFTAADAIEDAVKDGANVINCSWGVSQTPRDGTCVWCKTAERAATLGVVVVKSAGNSGPDGGSLTCPANAKGDVIVVGASSHNGQDVMEFSSRGPTADGREKPDFIAPGDNITAAKDGGGYRSLSGTSMAAPHVAGMAALILQRHPKLKPYQVRKILLDSAASLDSSQYDRNTQGTGLVDVVKVMRLAARPAPDAAATPSLTVIERLQRERLRVVLKNIGQEVMRNVVATLSSKNTIKVTKDKASYGVLAPGGERAREDYEIEFLPRDTKPGPHIFTLKVTYRTPTGQDGEKDYDIPYTFKSGS